ncbi:amyloid protein-binding protein 2 isoform X2 [Halyomorpha halys]|uniref:amyloid protein-binding protein 2 isoform X2 n=1 Tax=Halyomorpha halys TaxID=286706 RepID=UPI0006D4F896|nr:amyloid protein-binding protein 2 isoform X2 [Halyomorpha halys]
MTDGSNCLSLYDITVAAVCQAYKFFKNDFRYLPEPILFDIYIMLYQQARLCVLGMEFSDLDIFSRMLKVQNRTMLIKCFQELMKHGTGVNRELTNTYIKRCSEKDMTLKVKESLIDLGIKLGSFFCDAGWLTESCEVLTHCKNLCLTMPDNEETWRKTLECCYKLLHAEVIYSQYDSATETKQLAEELVVKLKNKDKSICFAGIYTQFSLYCFHMSLYDLAYRYSVMAVKDLGDGQGNPKILIEALSQASKSCVVKREFTKAEALSTTAVYYAKKLYGEKHLKHADALLDYGFYLLNSDSMKDSVTVYEMALNLKEEVFGSLNLHVAVTHEELAYALYVHEYSSGRFYQARKHAEKAIAMMMQLLPKEHLLLASAQRVKALILEEIALDHMSDFSEDLSFLENKLLFEAETLHKDALRLARLSFGEDNVQTAKHYGNLGRLYQSMRRYKEAESMHLKAIEIKEKLLGDDDYEVGLSVGHLASLYNYHMKEYKKAELLYFRSIRISLKLFSETYSGLEYDYRGLMHVYESLGDYDNSTKYMTIIARWKRLREESETRRNPPLLLTGAPTPIEELQDMFSLCSEAEAPNRRCFEKTGFLEPVFKKAMNP